MLSYGTKIGYSPIDIKIGTIRKPLLRDVEQLGFTVFEYYEGLLVLTPKLYVESKKKLGLVQEDIEPKSSLYEVIRNDKMLSEQYTEMLNFFFIEDVIFLDGFFFILSDKKNSIDGDTSEDRQKISAKGYISDENLNTVLSIIAELCFIKNESDEKEEPKFKNKEARRLYEKLKKAKEDGELRRKADKNYTIPNIISAVSNKHPSLNYTNIFSLTVFQLMDSFNRLQLNNAYDINSTTVAVWGDEKKTFDVSLWFKNENDKT